MSIEHQHKDMVAKLVKPGTQILQTMSAQQAHLVHMAMGIAGEAGELLDAIKKSAIYGKQLDMDNVMEELGDLEFYMEGLRRALLIKRDQTLKHNYLKLGNRYENHKYSDEQAIERRDKNI